MIHTNLTMPGFLSDNTQTAVTTDGSSPLSTPPLTIFCDLDGPLIDVSQRYYRTYQLALAETQDYALARGKTLSLTPLTLNQFWRLKQAKRPDLEIASLSGLAPHDFDYFLQQVQRLVNQPLLLQEDQLQPGVGAALEQLLGLGAQLAVVTLRCQSQAVQVLRQHHIARYFRFIRGTQETQAAYQNYAICKQTLLQDTIATMGASGHQMWMIGDTEADVLSAQALNIQTIALTCGMRDHAFLQGLQPTSIQDDLTAATQFVTEAIVTRDRN